MINKTMLLQTKDIGLLIKAQKILSSQQSYNFTIKDNTLYVDTSEPAAISEICSQMWSAIFSNKLQKALCEYCIPEGKSHSNHQIEAAFDIFRYAIIDPTSNVWIETPHSRQNHNIEKLILNSASGIGIMTKERN